MSTDYAAIEREFLDSLEADTGRDLDGWMHAIDAARLPHRNDIIDWLRHQGFLFARASWLERIHNNGGKPLYAGRPAGKIVHARRPQQPERPFPAPLNAVSSPAPSLPAAEPTPSSPVPAPPALSIVEPAPVPDLAPAAPDAATPAAAPVSAPPPTPSRPAPAAAGLDEALARAKAFRPLAQYLLRTVDKAVPGTEVSIRDGNLCLARPKPYALIVVSPRDLRLFVDIGGDAPGAQLQPARLPGLEPRFRHMLILNDARQLNADLESLLRVADAHVNNPR